VHSAETSSGDREPYKRVVMSLYIKMGGGRQDKTTGRPVRLLLR